MSTPYFRFRCPVWFKKNIESMSVYAGESESEYVRNAVKEQMMRDNTRLKDTLGVDCLGFGDKTVND